MKMQKTQKIMLNDKYVLIYTSATLFVYGEPKTVWTIGQVDGISAGNMGGHAVGVNAEYILFKQEANRKFDKSVWYETMNKVTGERKIHVDRPAAKDYGRFSKILYDFVEGE